MIYCRSITIVRRTYSSHVENNHTTFIRLLSLLPMEKLLSSRPVRIKNHRVDTVTPKSTLLVNCLCPSNNTEGCIRRSSLVETTKASHVSALGLHQQFQVLITLFPEYFSSFAQATCSLSEFGSYWALRGTHLAIPAPFSKYRTHQFEHWMPYHWTLWDCHPSQWFIPEYSCSKSSTSDQLINHNSAISQANRFWSELYHCHSPLLMVSQLLSIPRLSDMLKFSRWASTKSDR